MKWKLLAAVAVFVGLVSLRLIWMTAEHRSDPVASGGVIDLRGWDPDSGKIVSLSGEWSFYPSRLLAPADEYPERERTSLQVPGGWDGLLGSPFGYGTYRLEVLLPDSLAKGKHRLAIRTTIIRNAHNLFVNGTRVGGKGIPAASKEDYKPFVMPYSAGFDFTGNRLELSVQAANYHYGVNGGIFQEIGLGTPEAIERASVLRNGQNAMLMGLFLVCGFTFLILFLFRKQNRELLYFSIFFWMSLLFWMTHNERLLFWLLPDLPYEWQARLQVLGSAPLFFSLVGFVSSLYPRNANRWIIRIAFAGMVGFTAMYLFTEAEFFTRTEWAITIFDLLMALYACYILGRVVVSGNPDAVYSIIAGLCIIYEGVFQGLYYMGLYRTDSFPPVEKFVFALTMALMIAKRFFHGLREIERLSEKLIVADRLKNDFLANTASELKLPLHGMINIAQVMMNDDSMGERQAERLSLLMATGRRLSHLLNDMLDLSKLSEGGLELQKRPVDIRVLVSGVSDVMRYLKDGRTVRFDNRVEAGIAPVLADENRLMQVLFHLFHYAVKWSAQGTVVILAEEQRQRGVVKLTVRVEGGQEKPREEGEATDISSDLSLDISRKLLGLHGSEMDVAWKDDGLCITFGLAAGEEEPVTGLPPSLSDRDSYAPRVTEESGIRRHRLPDAPRVLLVDDDPVSLSVMFDLMAQERLDVTALRDGNEALRLIEQEGGWDLIVLEAMLPQLSGYDVTRKIRERHSFYDLPVLFVTVRSQPAYLLVGFDAGANDYLVKPFKASEFLARTRMLLKMKQSIAERLDIEMALIQAQIKPHFLYNTLNTIASLSETDPDGTRELLVDFGKYLQSCFDLRNLDRKVPFEKEWTLVQSYLNIEQARFGERIRIQSELDENLDFSLPPLTLQPIVENALRHGVLKRYEGGRIEIMVTREQESVRISVRDNGVGFPQTKKAAILGGTYRSGIGLVNVHRRLTNAYGQGLAIDSTEGEGTEVSFRIPLPLAEEKEEIA